MRRRSKAKQKRSFKNLVFFMTLLIGGHAMSEGKSSKEDVTVRIDPVSRYVHVAYKVPKGAPKSVTVSCAWAYSNGEWHPAKVTPLVSDTALALVSDEEAKAWIERGVITERRAAGLERTVVFNPYPQAHRSGILDVRFRIRVADDEREWASYETRIEADNSDVVFIDDWKKVLQEGAVLSQSEAGAEGRVWHSLPHGEKESATDPGPSLKGSEHATLPLPALTYPLSLSGAYAIHVHGASGIRMRLTGDERSDIIHPSRTGRELLWRWCRMDRQHLVVKQRHQYTGWSQASLGYVRLVPLSEEHLARLEEPFTAKKDKIVAGYWEPYSWAFHDNVSETLQHREQITAFADARLSILDTQIGRFGAKVVYESRLTDPLIYATIGDPIGKVSRPTTNNVGKMQQYTNTLDATIRYSRELGLKAHANFGASNCYPGSPLQGDFSKDHPDWMRGSALRFEVPEVRQFVLSLYREALEIGATGISMDYCRYPETVDAIETGNAMMAELRKLADEFAPRGEDPISILVRFPGGTVRRSDLFDYRTWAQEGWVDYLCPSNIQGRHHHIDMTPYIEAVKGTDCTLLPCADGLGWGLTMPGPFLWRVAQLYDQGIPGMYVYQADSRVLGRAEQRRTMAILCSSQAVKDWWQEDQRSRPSRSKGIYITPSNRHEGYHSWERLRIWLEGVEMGEVEVFLNDQLVNRFPAPPYLLGTEEYASDKAIPKGESLLRIRAKDGEGWLEQTFKIKGA